MKRALRSFRASKVMTLAQLVIQLQCSARTVQRRLKDWRALTSYNHNGRYYCLPEVPQFDSFGLWHYQGIGFSQFGNLRATVVGLLDHCPAGLSARELGQHLGMAPHDFLSHFRDFPEVKREKHQGCFVYFSSHPQLYEQQRQRRLKLTLQEHFPSDREAIAILVEKIKSPELDFEQLANRLLKQFPAITAQSVQDLFAYHGLALKKRHLRASQMSQPLSPQIGESVVQRLPFRSTSYNRLSP